MVMKVLDFLQQPIVQLLRKFHRNISANEGEGHNYREKRRKITIFCKFLL